MDIFVDRSDFTYFIGLMQRYLDPSDEAKDGLGVTYKKFLDNFQLNCFCLMNNHFHFLLNSGDDAKNLSGFMTSISTSYTMYFNKKYSRRGPLFESRYKASRIDTSSYLLHITRYIHLNPKLYLEYPWSSISDYLHRNRRDWVHPELILELFDGDYKEFLSDFLEHREMLKEIKHELANL